MQHKLLSWLHSEYVVPQVTRISEKKERAMFKTHVLPQNKGCLIVCLWVTKLYMCMPMFPREKAHSKTNQFKDKGSYASFLHHLSLSLSLVHIYNHNLMTILLYKLNNISIHNNMLPRFLFIRRLTFLHVILSIWPHN